MEKAHYGIDAPIAIKQLLLTSFFSLLLAFFCYKFYNSTYPTLVYGLQFTFFAFSLVHFSFALLMIWSSLYGKFAMREKIITALKLQGNEQILDVGCGRGLLLIGLAKKLNDKGRAFGIDLWRSEDLSKNDEVLTRKNARLENVENKIALITGDMRKMEFSDHYFDIVVSSMAIHNVSCAKEREKSLQEIFRVLKPGGRIIILDFKYTKKYVEYLKHLGCDTQISKPYYGMFPPVWVIQAKK